MFIGNDLLRCRRLCALLIGVILVVLTSACQHTTPTEEKIIGMWELTGLDATGRVVFRRDHTVVDLFPEDDMTHARWFATSSGKWRLDESDIVEDMKDLTIA